MTKIWTAGADRNLNPITKWHLGIVIGDDPIMYSIVAACTGKHLVGSTGLSVQVDSREPPDNVCHHCLARI